MNSHINTFLGLSQVLQRRGHRVTFFNTSDHEARIRQAGADFELREPTNLPAGTVNGLVQRLGDARPLESARMLAELGELRHEDLIRNGPDAVKRAGIDALVVDQMEFSGGTVAEIAGLPWVSVSNALCLNSEPALPPFFLPWLYSVNRGAILRNRVAYGLAAIAMRKDLNLINRGRLRAGLPPHRRVDDSFSPFAQICQQNAEFDFPRCTLPETFHYVGPIERPAAPEPEFPWDRLDGRPLIYASLGTIVNRHPHFYLAIAQACADSKEAGIQAQLVISLGGADPRILGELAGSPIVVRYAPQRKLLARSFLTITHAGLNTTLESLREGVPLVAIPITFEQPGIAARIRWTRTGDFIHRLLFNTARLRETLERVVRDPVYRQSAGRMKAAIAATRGAEHAADIIQQVCATGRPVAAGRLTMPC
jgi:zeaxanthin glucosyltransferase